MLSERELSAAIGSTAYAADGEKVGTVEHFFVDDRTGAPTWVAVLTGLLGTRQSVAPAVDATFADGALRLPVSRDAVRRAPTVDGTHLDPAQEAALRQHYAPADAGSESVGRPVTEAGPAPWTRTDAGVVPVGARTEESPPGRTRLVTYVVTEEVQITVPVRREEVRVEQLPADAPDPGAGESLVAADRPTGVPGEIVLHAEKPVVTVEVVPVERVRLRTELVEGRPTVSDQVQREPIAVEPTPSS
jgi:Domain of unknown function (DUF2382)/PRC-barrel domain